MKTRCLLILLAVGFSACREKPTAGNPYVEAQERQEKLISVYGAAYQVVLDRARCDRPSAKPSDTVDYERALETLDRMAAAAKAAGFTDDEVSLQMSRGEDAAKSYVAK